LDWGHSLHRSRHDWRFGDHSLNNGSRGTHNWHDWGTWYCNSWEHDSRYDCSWDGDAEEVEKSQQKGEPNRDTHTNTDTDSNSDCLIAAGLGSAHRNILIPVVASIALALSIRLNLSGGIWHAGAGEYTAFSFDSVSILAVAARGIGLTGAVGVPNQRAVLDTD
jgi:hypothetical protein